MGPLDCNIRGNVLKQAAGDDDAPAPIALRQCAWKLEPGRTAARSTLRQIGELESEQERRLREAQPGRDQQLGEERVPSAIAIAGAGPLDTIDCQGAKPDVAEDAVILK